MNRPILERIPPEMLEAYRQRKITSYDVAAALDVNPASVRRAIVKRAPRENRAMRSEDKKKLFACRREFRATIAHLPIQEIMERANVKISTAYRIKKRYATEPAV